MNHANAPVRRPAKTTAPSTGIHHLRIVHPVFTDANDGQPWKRGF
jgi:hypothetical protein